jgi:formylglycine-generating enzyme required for sulfatase activity
MMTSGEKSERSPAMSRFVKLCFLPLALLAVVLYVLWLVLGVVRGPDIDMKLVLIPAGKFVMGSPKDDKDRHPSEEPQHEVEVKAFYLGAYEVTQGQYRKVTGTNPSCFSPTGEFSKYVRGLNTDDFPVEQITWYDAQAFCERLSALPRERAEGRVYRLPTEAEWEYACRAGTTTPYYTGDTISLDQANTDGARHRLTPVGSYPPNPWGLYDMAGNVKEWCQDKATADYTRDGVAKLAPEDKDGRCLRGGDWLALAWQCRSAKRGSCRPDYRQITLGFRVACDLRPEPR